MFNVKKSVVNNPSNSLNTIICSLNSFISKKCFRATLCDSTLLPKMSLNVACRVIDVARRFFPGGGPAVGLHNPNFILDVLVASAFVLVTHPGKIYYAGGERPSSHG